MKDEMKFGSILLLLSLIACAPRSGGVEVVAQPETPRDVRVDSIVESEVFPPLTWELSAFDVAVTVTTTQSDSSATDSISLSRQLILEPDSQEVGAGLLTIRIDPPLQDTMVVDSAHLRVGQDGRMSLVDLDGKQCHSRSPVLTPILVRQLLYPVSSKVLYPGTSFADSLVYNNCVRGVSVSVAVRFKWERAYTDSATSSVPVTLLLDGTMKADSSRQFPMRLAGQLSGKGRAVYQSSTLELDTLFLDVESIIETVAGERKQAFSQYATYLVRTRDTPKD